MKYNKIMKYYKILYILLFSIFILCSCENKNHINADTHKSEIVELYYEKETENASIKIPQINISPEIDSIVNSEIKEIFAENVTNTLKKDDPIITVDYVYYINNNILSLIVEQHEGVYVNTKLYCVNIDLENEIIISLPYYLSQNNYKWLDIVNDAKKYLYDNFYEKEHTLIKFDDRNNFFINEHNEIIILADVTYCYSGNGYFLGYDAVQYYSSYNLTKKEGLSIYTILN